MGLRCSFDIQDMGFNVATPQLGIEPDYSEGFDIFAETFIDVATDLVPVDTGNLLSSIDESHDDTSIECVADCEYAQYVEFGTIKMSAQPYFIPALNAAYLEAKYAWEEAWEDALEEEAEILAEMEAEAAESEEDSGGGGSFIGGLLGVLLAAVVIGLIRGFFDMLRGTESSGRGIPKSVLQGGSEMESLVEIT